MSVAPISASGIGPERRFARTALGRGGGSGKSPAGSAPAPVAGLPLRQPVFRHATGSELLKIRRTRLAPPEQPLDIGEAQFNIGRAAMATLTGMGCRLHLTQQRVHLSLV